MPIIRFFCLLLFCLLLCVQLALPIPGWSMKETTNRLIDEQSPYLLQHSHNPVDWYPWGEEAFAKARKEGKLIFLSIGYSTCHWCHVMEEESFADAEVAALLNRDYVAIKVDREERPDIDQFYMRVTIEMSGSGGWPMTLLLTPEKIPVYAATYLPKTRRYDRPGLLELLPQAAAAWRKNPEQLIQNGQQLISRWQKTQNRPAGKAAFSPELFDQAVTSMRASFDRKRAGFGKAPKFPRPHSLSFLLQRYYRSGDKQLLQMVEQTLQAMRAGGIYDQLGFGFHRYSTDADWLVPHFEKMLYDQSGLARVYLEAYQLTGKQEYADTAREVFSYVLSRMRDPKGGFYSAEDADSEGVEGRFYVWQYQKILELLGEPRGSRFAEIFEVQKDGNFAAEVPGEAAAENILHLRQPLSVWAEKLRMTPGQLRRELEEDRRTLFRAREARPHPFLDDKVLTAWNGLMISSLAIGANYLDDPELLAAAEKSADFILSQLRDSKGRLLRRWRQNQAAIPAFAADYAFLARGLLDLYRAGLQPQRLQQAVDLAEQLLERFMVQGQLYETEASSDLPLRTRELYDGALPSTGSVAIEVFARLFLLTGDK